MDKKKRARKKISAPVLILRVCLCVLLALILCVVGLFGYLTVTEFRPNAAEPAETLYESSKKIVILPGETYTALSMNIGYAGLGEESDFFMDGGKSVRPDETLVVKNMDGIQGIIRDTDWDFLLLQEVDRDSRRSYRIDEGLVIAEMLQENTQYITNYSCDFVPYPVPMIGRVHSGLLSASYAEPLEGKRISLPVPFSWPVRLANLKRALLVQRFQVADTDKQLVMINLHLEAYDDGEGKKQQTDVLLNLILSEYEKGNYVIAGGDFNQSFPDALEAYPILDENLWTPGILSEEMLPEGWSFQYDVKTPSCRLLNAPLNSGECRQFYVIDGFICSPNVSTESVDTLDRGFEFSDHNPVLLQFTLVP
ncbi:MAG: endonuclease/exonuclease/phosphatase family protein [Clostridia bacterium]|nr:endonuclease/exonuclease/phosphatase family protein [Clostridia bacterium]